MQTRFVIVSLTLAGAIGLFAYSNATRTPSANTASTRELAISSPFAESTDARPNGESRAIEAPTPDSEEITAEMIDAWIADAAHQDEAKRSAAIVALAQAPKARALPVLRNVLEIGDEPDRQLALRSLHTLAIRQGDEDGRIREALRYTIYHGDDDGVSQSAQGYLEDLDTVL